MVRTSSTTSPSILVWTEIIRFLTKNVYFVWLVFTSRENDTDRLKVFFAKLVIFVKKSSPSKSVPLNVNRFDA